ncbi:hypothetical protein GGI42DRAFT_331876 [Trichoderma sp. SZMC 28013]
MKPAGANAVLASVSFYKHGFLHAGKPWLGTNCHGRIVRVSTVLDSMLSIAFTWLAARGGYEALIWYPCGSGPPDAWSMDAIMCGSFPAIRYQLTKSRFILLTATSAIVLCLLYEADNSL